MSARRLRPGKVTRFEDPVDDSAHRDHRERIDEIQQQPFVGARLIKAVELSDLVEVTIRHGLGKAPSWVGVSVPYAKSGSAVTAGQIFESRDQYTTGTPIDRSQFVVLVAHAFTATITVDVVVVP
jgi:hypothetical protein